ncbi:MAG: magnesium transporter CorA [Pelomonas sp.]|nr:magnesium transporter CorA [Roseateles sp.]
MRCFAIGAEDFRALDAAPAVLPAEPGFVWLSLARSELERELPRLQATLQDWGLAAIVELHAHDLASEQLPAHFEPTSWYDLMVFRRLASADAAAEAPINATPAALAAAIDTRPVGFVVYERVLVSVHPDDCRVRDFFVERLRAYAQGQRGAARLPTSPDELMLRMLNHMVDGYLELRRVLAREFAALHRRLLDPRRRFDDWPLVLAAREALAGVAETCEDQRGAVQEWLDALDEWGDPVTAPARRERELLRVRGRDVLEHVERVLAHVHRLDATTDSAVQMHFSALGQRTNRIMQTLTVLTAIFLPLNLVTGIFGMNFDRLPLIHLADGFWLAMGLMALLAAGLAVYFWRKRYLDDAPEPRS